ncbi:ferredoxin--nitrite reductase [Gloeobacter violaceus]|uniref:Ferredoxin nitrite reductase n=1 Tax=Gloeobacter violaceus (strain ATCC 29082 / PCC 7421) TaxID=251221 RepID=Q7NKC1_GLOVI|nr:ferredoxin--nitrite reductase [Gloeobacter violaceus]BAC89498.1 ferredoxin nitrite reductase [Gloeobacter violaceus PCC 7421]
MERSCRYCLEGAVANPIEKIKDEKPGLAVKAELIEFARLGWEAISKGDLERLKWIGWFFRKKTPGRWMVRLRVPGGILSSEQLRVVGGILAEFSDVKQLDITTRQNLEMRGLRIEDSVSIQERLEAVGLTTVQSGMDNVRNIVGSPVAGIDPDELIDVRPLVQQMQDLITEGGRGSFAFSNLPRKFNISITGDRENSAHAEINDIGFIPARREERIGFNVLVGGVLNSQRATPALPLDAFVLPEQVAPLCAAVLRIYSDHGPREARTRARLIYLLEDWGISKFRAAVEADLGFALPPAAHEEFIDYDKRDHVGVWPQKQAGYCFVGLHVPIGRLWAHQALEVADLAEVYGQGEVRLTVEQSFLIPHVAEEKLEALLVEPLLAVFSPEPNPLLRGLVSCTGAQFCNLAIIETKERALKLAHVLASELDLPQPVRIHWSGCPNSCGQPQIGDIGLIGTRTKVAGQSVDAVDILMGGQVGREARFGEVVREGVPCDELAAVLKGLLIEHFGAEERPVALAS